MSREMIFSSMTEVVRKKKTRVLPNRSQAYGLLGRRLVGAKDTKGLFT